jgi:hypothetical protein
MPIGSNTEEQELLETLKKVEALFSGTTFDGERVAAAEAIERIRERLRSVQATQPPEEFSFSMPDSWSRRLFTALLCRYGIQPYRYRGQRRTTVMARVPRGFLDETLWPEFNQLNQVLRSYLERVTERVIKASIYADDAEAEIRNEPTALADGRGNAAASAGR